MNNPFNLNGKTILVTGASSGIGRQTAITLSFLGARVVLVARNETNLNETALKLHGIGHLVRPFDFSETALIPDWMKSLSSEIGPMSGVVHSAGVHSIRPIRMLTPDDFGSIFKVNVEAAVMLAKGFRQKGVRSENGGIVFVSSVAGIVGQPGVSLYCATKGALISLSKSLALELASEGIRVNCVAPGVVETEMSGTLRDKLTPDQYEKIQSMHPLGLGQAEDVANSIAFLLSPAARWITGTTLIVDGGYTAH